MTCSWLCLLFGETIWIHACKKIEGENIVKFARYIARISILKTLSINFKLLPLKQAWKVPIVIGRYTTVDIKGRIKIECPVHTGLIVFGIGGSEDMYHFGLRRNYLRIQKENTLVFYGKAVFATHSSVLAAGGDIIFGKNFSCNNGCRIAACEGIVFGNDVMLGGNCVIRDSDGHAVMDMDAKGFNKRQKSAKVTIGNHVWLANNSSVLKGVDIADNVILAYGGVATSSLQYENAIYAGIPAKMKKQNICWIK